MSELNFDNLFVRRIEHFPELRIVNFSDPDLFASSGWGEGAEGAGAGELLVIGVKYGSSRRIYCLSSYKKNSKLNQFKPLNLAHKLPYLADELGGLGVGAQVAGKCGALKVHRPLGSPSL